MKLYLFGPVLFALAFGYMLAGFIAETPEEPPAQEVQEPRA